MDFLQKLELVYLHHKNPLILKQMHLVLPNCIEDSKKVLEDIKSILGSDAIVSLMSQYIPVGEAKNFPELNRKLKPIEYKIVKSYMYKLGLDGFVQELESANKNYIPDFNTN